MASRMLLIKQVHIFEELVSLQDSGLKVKESRQKICRRYSLSEYRLKQIENQGIARDWLISYDATRSVSRM